jgi:hypothetical protein
MSADKFFNIMGAIVTVALVSVIVGSAQTRLIIQAISDGFSGALRTAKART